MLMQCMTPGCMHIAEDDTLCPDCRQQSNGSRYAVDHLNIPTLEDLGAELLPDLAAVAAHQIQERQQRESVIKRLQKRLDFRGQVIRRLLALVGAEKARADGLEQQNEGLQAALSAQTEQLAQLEYLHTGKRQNGFAAVETAVGDWRPFDDAGYNTLYERIDPVTNRAVAWIWFRAESRGV